MFVFGIRQILIIIWLSFGRIVLLKSIIISSEYIIVADPEGLERG